MKMKSSKSWIIISLILAILLCSIAAYINTPLQAYIDTPAESPSASPSYIMPEMEEYSDGSVSFKYPSEWQQTTKNGNLAFLKPDGTYLMLQKSGYIPQINSATASSIQTELAANGMQLLNYEKFSTSSFLFSYQANSIITLEHVSWDQNNEYRLILTCKAEQLNEYQNLFNYVINSFSWKQEDPIPHTIALQYNAFGNFEFAFPASWTTGISSDSFCAANTETGTVLCVTVSESELVSLQDISQIQYAQQASQSRSTLYIKNYVASDYQITAECVYVLQGEQMLLYHILILRNGFLYEFLLDVPLSSGEDDYGLFMECLKYFRVF